MTGVQTCALPISIPILGNYVYQKEHPNKMVCSSWATALYEVAGVLTGLNYTKTMPQDLLEKNIFKGHVTLYGKPNLVRFNTI